ncbi:hypothetical protein RN001_003654 [Aquatica leii]|uniref:Regulatory protein zeste n=1 Tax=Aquatica leii TaxID=1421715 RepID=A0AAN7SRN8_9COLE|nr:hypothetical protein RN001_003654 [Aquatica leii]
MNAKEDVEGRKRSANFTVEEKLKLIKCIEENVIILNKKTDATTNKAKEDAWEVLTHNFNSGGVFKRNNTSLKKIWNKLKSDSKVYKAKQRINIVTTGGGPAEVKDDPILEKVLVLIGRSGVGLEGVIDSDMEFVNSCNLSLVEADIIDCDVNMAPSVASEALSIDPMCEAVPETIIVNLPKASTSTSCPKGKFSRRRPKLQKHRNDNILDVKLENEKKSQDY